MATYNEKEKNESRVRVIKHTITCLTTERDTSVCVKPYHVMNIWTKLMKTQEAMQHFSQAERLRISDVVEEWEAFRKSRVQTKTAQDLRVCYLAGDNPMNDLEVLVDNGILTQNIWAIEKDVTKLKSVLESDHQRLKNFKLFKGDLIDFLTDKKEQFDIIYYDACGTLPSARQKTLKVIGTVFMQNKLTSPGALITNFSFPPEQGPGKQDSKDSSPQDEERNRIKSLAEQYCKYRESITQGQSNEVQHKRAISTERTAEEIYSDYITYQVCDSAAVYIPAFRMLHSAKQSLWDQLYTNKTKFLKEVMLFDAGKKFKTSSEAYLKAISGNKLGKSWVNEIFPNWNDSSLQKEEISSLLLTHHLSCSEEFIGKFANESFKICLKRLGEGLAPDTNGANMPPRFCDKLDAASATRLVGGLLYGQLAVPSFPVVDKQLRLCYTAKKRKMFSDVFIFDTCSYLYDQFSSVDFAIDSINSEQQLLIRMILNGLRPHLKAIYNDQFCNVADLHVNSLKIPQREYIYADSTDLVLYELEDGLMDTL